MRKIVFLLVLLSFAFSLSASRIIADESLPDDVLSILSESIGRMTYGRGDTDFTASSYSETVGIDGYISCSFTLAFGEKTILAEASGKDRAEFLSSVDTEIENILFYQEMFSSETGETLEYIIPPIYSFSPEGHYRKGTVFRAVDSYGNVRGMFELAEIYGQDATLEPLYLNSPYPGFSLLKSGSWKSFVTASSSFTFPSPDVLAMASVGRTDLIYPFVPVISVAYCLSSGISYIYGGIGIEAYMNLNRIFPYVSFTLVQEGRIGGHASILIGGSGSGFDWKSFFSIFYEHSMTPSLFWRLGYGNLQGRHMIYLGIGGAF